MFFMTIHLQSKGFPVNRVLILVTLWTWQEKLIKIIKHSIFSYQVGHFFQCTCVRSKSFYLNSVGSTRSVTERCKKRERGKQSRNEERESTTFSILRHRVSRCSLANRTKLSTSQSRFCSRSSRGYANVKTQQFIRFVWFLHMIPKRYMTSRSLTVMGPPAQLRSLFKRCYHR